MCENNNNNSCSCYTNILNTIVTLQSGLTAIIYSRTN